ncbi:MAG: CBS domain-containing protein [Pirellulaceae bacterium]|nr:CBS domain-containing protein [Pirellulaceae bacterium]
MTICPHCGFENIEGVDECAECRHSLADTEEHVPATEVERALMHDQIAVLASRPAITVPPETPIRDVLRLLVEKEIGCVVITRDGKLAGIFSERDALMKLNVQADELGDEPVSRFMTPDPQALSYNHKVAFAVQRMDQGSFRHVPIVTDDQTVTAIISARDIMHYLTEKMRQGGAEL